MYTRAPRMSSSPIYLRRGKTGQDGQRKPRSFPHFLHIHFTAVLTFPLWNDASKSGLIWYTRNPICAPLHQIARCSSAVSKSATSKNSYIILLPTLKSLEYCRPSPAYRPRAYHLLPQPCQVQANPEEEIGLVLPNFRSFRHGLIH